MGSERTDRTGYTDPEISELRRKFAQLLDRDWRVWLPDRYATLRRKDPLGRRLGIEIEGQLFTGPGLIPAVQQGSLLLDWLKGPPINGKPELARCNYELESPDLHLAGAPFMPILRDLIGKQRAVQTYAGELDDVTAGLIGAPPTWLARYFQDPAGLVVELQRYLVYLERMQAWTFRQSLAGGGVAVEEFPTIMGITPFAASQFTLGVPIERAHDYYDAANIVSALLRAIFANADCAYGHETAKLDTRADGFATATVLNHSHRTFIGPRWTKSFFDMMKAIFDQVGWQTTFLDADEDVDGSAIETILTCLYPWNRPRLHLKKEYAQEQRICSTGPTMAFAVAQAAFGTGAIELVASQIDKWRRIDFGRIQGNLNRSGNGLRSELLWYHNGHTEMGTALEIARAIFDDVRAALISRCHVDSRDVDLALMPVRQILEAEMTPADWLRRMRHTLMDGGMSYEDARVESFRTYLYATDHGSSTAPMSTWDLARVA
jgi:hypothetical protein